MKYTSKDIGIAINELLNIIEQKMNEEEFELTIDKLCEEFPLIQEVHLSGPNGYCGIGVGKYGGHAIE